MNNNFDKIDKNIFDAARKGDADTLMSKLNEPDRKKVQELLADQEKLKQILSSDTAQKLMKFLGGNKNG